MCAGATSGSLPALIEQLHDEDELIVADTPPAAGKLSDEDFRRQDAELRREAVEILKQLDAAGVNGSSTGAGGSAP